jgi:REP element-mobilizing transposase RayT
MPQSLSAVYIHLVFSTKERLPFFRDPNLRQRLHAELGGISKKLGCAPMITGGVEDHIHQLVRFGRTISQAEWVRELKRVSNLWLKDTYSIRDFKWQVVMQIFL